MSSGNNRYEWWIVVLLSLLWGIVLLNRVVIVYLFPIIIPEFKMTYAQAGGLTSILALAFALSSWFFGGISDRIGRKKVLLPATIFFSVISWFSGLTTSFVQMLVARGVLGLGQGPIMPTSIATIAIESTPSRRGLNFGLHQALAPLIAFGIGAIITTQLTAIMSWEMVFVIVGIPGLAIGIVLLFYMREPKNPDQIQTSEAQPQEKIGFFTPLRYKNVVLSSMVTILYMCCLFVFATFSIVYMTTDLHFTIKKAGIVMSLMGFTAFFGCILLPMLSDYIGRKPVLILSLFSTAAGLFGFMTFSSNYSLLSASVAFSGFFMGGVAPIAIAALTTESVPPFMAATASGIPVMFGEILGSALMPFAAGYFADFYGLKVALFFTVVAPLVAGIIALFYSETAPGILAGRAA